jgi:UDP-glucose:(heptosyl)LPS alpha-1,3-glucosyltransferase
LKLAFCLLKYFPFGGMQRDLLHMVEEARRRGHDATVYTGDWQGPAPQGLRIVIVPPRGFANHRKHGNFHIDLQAMLRAEAHDLLIGFNKMPGLDVYYAADLCLRERALRRSFLYRATPRYRLLENFESAVFAPAAGVDVLLLTEAQGEDYRRQYGTLSERLHVLPPDIAADRILPAYDEAAHRAARERLGVQRAQRFVLMLGSGFKTKGLDRALTAMQRLPDDLRARLVFWVVGQDNPAPFVRMAKKLGLGAQVRFTGGRDDVPTLLQAADLLIHPAYHENTGTVLLEALASGVPIIVTDTCGYAEHVARGAGGIVLSSPFAQSALDDALRRLLENDEREAWGRRGIAYVHGIDTSARFVRALDIVEKRGAGRS